MCNDASKRSVTDWRTGECMHRRDLPAIADVPQGLRNGRSIHDGYARGWGLEFGDLRLKIADDPVYRAAAQLAEGRSVQSERNRMNIFLILKFFTSDLPPGDVVEFGAYKGGSAIFMAKVCQMLLPGTRVFAFDTFTGIPNPDPDVDQHHVGDFGDVDYEALVSFVAAAGLSNLHLIKGRFEDTVPEAFDRIPAIRLAHIDCDVQPAVEYSYEISKPKMAAGGYVVFDDALYELSGRDRSGRRPRHTSRRPQFRADLPTLRVPHLERTPRCADYLTAIKTKTQAISAPVMA